MTLHDASGDVQAQGGDAQSFELFMRALAVASSLGKPGSAFVGKLFMSGDFQAARKAVKDRYSKEQTVRPAGTRSVSSEVFLVGMGLRAPTPR